MKESPIWWIRYSIGGKKIRESAQTTVHREAVQLLNQRLTERGRVVTRRDLEKVTFGELENLIIADYVKNGRKSIRRVQTAFHHLRAFFGGWRVIDIREDAIDRYVVDRLAQGAARASVNRELAHLRRSIKLAQRAGLARDIPTFQMLQENNTRKGFFEASAFEAVLEKLPAHLRPLAQAGYLTGWRKGELLTRCWRHVDFDEGWLRLEPGETKSGKGRMFPLIDQLSDVLQAQLARKKETERTTGRVVTALFFYDDGRPILDFRRPWNRACAEAGHPDLIFHDLRRTAARNLVRAGVPTALAKKFTGHETDSVFQRYAIEDETSLREAGEKYAEKLRGMTLTSERQVLEIG